MFNPVVFGCKCKDVLKCNCWSFATAVWTHVILTTEYWTQRKRCSLMITSTLQPADFLRNVCKWSYNDSIFSKNKRRLHLFLVLISTCICVGVCSAVQRFWNQFSKLFLMFVVNSAVVWWTVITQHWFRRNTREETGNDITHQSSEAGELSWLNLHYKRWTVLIKLPGCTANSELNAGKWITVIFRKILHWLHDAN